MPATRPFEHTLTDYFVLTNTSTYLRIGGWTIRIDRRRPEIKEALPATYRPFLVDTRDPDLIIETIPDQPLDRREGPVLFDHAPLWRLTGERIGRRWYEVLARDGSVVRRMTLESGSRHCTVESSPFHRTMLQNHPDAEHLAGALLVDPFEQLLFVDRLTSCRAGLLIHAAAVAEGDIGYAADR